MNFRKVYKMLNHVSSFGAIHIFSVFLGDQSRSVSSPVALKKDVENMEKGNSPNSSFINYNLFIN